MIRAQPQRRHGRELRISAADPSRRKQRKAKKQNHTRHSNAAANFLARDSDNRRKSQIPKQKRQNEIVANLIGREIADCRGQRREYKQ